MTPQILKKLADYRDDYNLGTGTILEVGSLDVNGSPRSVFTKAKKYTGLDLVEGRGVDVVHDYTKNAAFGYLGFEIIDLVICCEVIEHVPRFWRIIDHLYFNCARGGHIIISAPANGFPYHAYPIDCYRFMEDAFCHFYTPQQCELLDLSQVFDTHYQPGWVGLWRKK